MNNNFLKFLMICIIIMSLITLCYVQIEQKNILIDTVEVLKSQQEKTDKQVKKLNMQIEIFINKWNVEFFEVTAYAPLDPNAIRGMCFSGNPKVTASGKQLEVGKTIATGKNIPFGTDVYIQGFGWRVAQDRGGMIKENNIDIAVQTKKEALKIGRRKAIVVWKKEMMPL